MTDSDLTISILRDIREALLKNNARLDATNERLDLTNERLDKGFAGVVAVLKHHDARFAAIEGQLKQLSGELVFLGRYVKNRTEKELRSLKARVAKLERKVG